MCAPFLLRTAPALNKTCLLLLFILFSSGCRTHSGEKCLGHRLPSCGPPVNKWQFTGHQYQIPLVWATRNRYPCMAHQCQIPATLATNVAMSRHLYNTIPNYLNWIQFKIHMRLFQSADVRTRCARLRARWRTGAPGGLRAPTSRSRPEAVHSRRESHQNRKDSKERDSCLLVLIQ